MPKQQDSNTLSLPQLLQLAGIGGQPQQDTTREALSYMQGQQRLAAEEADRKVREQQAMQEHQYRMKALEQQSAHYGQEADAANLRALATVIGSTIQGTPEHSAAVNAWMKATGQPMPVVPVEKTHVEDVTNPPVVSSPFVDKFKANPGRTIGEGIRAIPSAIGTGVGNFAGNFHDMVNTVAGISNEPIYNQQLKLKFSPELLAHIQATYPQTSTMSDYLNAVNQQLVGGGASPQLQPQIQLTPEQQLLKDKENVRILQELRNLPKQTSVVSPSYRTGF